MTDAQIIAIMGVAGTILGVIVGKQFDIVLAKIKNRKEAPVDTATAEKAQAEADLLVTENYLRTITRIDNDNKRLEERLDDSDKNMATMRADYEARITVLERGRSQDKSIIETLNHTIRTQAGQITALEFQVVKLGGELPDRDRYRE